MRSIRMVAVCLVASLVLVGGLGAGCGSGGDGPGESPASATVDESTTEAATSPPAEPRKPTIKACLRSKGAELASSVDELAFLKRAEARGDAYEQGFFRDDTANIVINTLGRGKINGMPPEWYVWIGHPVVAPGEDLPSAIEVVESRPPKAFVAYVMRPSTRQRERIATCFE